MNDQSKHSTPDRNAVLEEAAKIADEAFEQAGDDRCDFDAGWNGAACEIAQTIRERKTTTPEPTDPAGVSEMADELEAMSLDEGQREFLEAMLSRGVQRLDLYRLFDAGCQVRAAADRMYWAVRNSDADAFKAAMTEYEQVVGLNFSAPDVAISAFSGRTPSPVLEVAKEALEKARHRLLKEGFLPADPTVSACNAALQAIKEAR